MPYHLYRQWAEFFEYEPFGSSWENWLMARQAHLIACIHSQKNKEPDFSSFIYMSDQERKDKEERDNSANIVSLMSFFDKKVK